jgi:hypothetical protein
MAGGNMSYKLPGVTSLILAFTAIGIADYYLFTVSPLPGVLYLLIVPIALVNNIFFYCRKCPHVHDKSCRRVLFGRVAHALFKPITRAPYTGREILLQLLPMLAYILFPQYWLIRNVTLFSTFWVLIIIAGILQIFFICPQCHNHYCLYRLRKKGK